MNSPHNQLLGGLADFSFLDLLNQLTTFLFPPLHDISSSPHNFYLALSAGHSWSPWLPPQSSDLHENCIQTASTFNETGHAVPWRAFWWAAQPLLYSSFTTVWRAHLVPVTVAFLPCESSAIQTVAAADLLCQGPEDRQLARQHWRLWTFPLWMRNLKSLVFRHPKGSMNKAEHL